MNSLAKITPVLQSACLWTLLFMFLFRWTHQHRLPLFYYCMSVDTSVHSSVQMNSLAKTTPVLLLHVCEHFCWYFCLDELINHYTSLWTTISWCVGLSFPRGASALAYSWADEVTHQCLTKMTVTKMKLRSFFFFIPVSIQCNFVVSMCL